MSVCLSVCQRACANAYKTHTHNKRVVLGLGVCHEKKEKKKKKKKKKKAKKPVPRGLCSENKKANMLEEELKKKNEF
jgi:hypothetical protein